MPEPERAGPEQDGYQSEDRDTEVVESMPAIMPFKDVEIEQDFLQHFHSQRTIMDCFMYLAGSLSAALGVRKQGHPWLGMSYALLNFGLFLTTFSKVYPLWRQYIMYAVRLSWVAYCFTLYPALVRSVKGPTFIAAAYYSGFYIARFKFPLYFAALWPAPLRGTFMVIHTFLIVVLLRLSKEECQELVIANADFREFARQLEGLYTLWEARGSQPACRHFCEDLLDVTMFPAGCQRMCSWTLPLVWRVYGRPWLGACVVHRFIMVVGLGYVLPLIGLYIWEMRDRSLFAKERRLITCSTKACLLKGVGPVLSELAAIMITLQLLTLEMQNL